MRLKTSSGAAFNSATTQGLSEKYQLQILKAFEILAQNGVLEQQTIFVRNKISSITMISNP